VIVVRCPECDREVAARLDGRVQKHTRSGFRGNGWETWPCGGSNADAALPLAVARARAAELTASSARSDLAYREARRADEVARIMLLAQQNVDAYDAATQRDRDRLAAKDRAAADADAAVAALRGAT